MARVVISVSLDEEGKAWAEFKKEAKELNLTPGKLAKEIIEERYDDK